MDEVKQALDKLESVLKRMESFPEVDPMVMKTLRLVVSDTLGGATMYVAGVVAAGRPDKVIELLDFVRARASSAILEIEQEMAFEKLTDDEKKETVN